MNSLPSEPPRKPISKLLSVNEVCIALNAIYVVEAYRATECLMLCFALDYNVSASLTLSNLFMGFPGDSYGKKIHKAGDLGSIFESGRSSGEGNV